MNHGIKKALKQDWKYLMGINCDDILLPDYWDKGRPYLEVGHPIIGMDQIIAYEVATGRALKIRLRYERDKCHVWGGGRFLSREAIERAVHGVYPSGFNSGLDKASQANINQFTPGDPVVIDGCYLLDMKDEGNINTFETYRSLGVKVAPGEVAHFINIEG
ncbi:MAG TPA: hypothetical protein ENI23_13645 [bacterium]|nr:hypothetical protein [bacterium]